MKIITGKNFPRGMGVDFSGTIMSVGPDVTRVKPGDAVFGIVGIKESGTLGEAVIAKANSVAKKPDNVSFEDAACLATPGVTSWNGLVDKAKLAAGQHVFINGCMGAVGEAAVQIARIRGASVSGSCSAGTMERARSFGLQSVFDYRTSALAKTSERFDVVYDTAATMTTKEGMGLLRKRGILLDLNPTPAKFIRSMMSRTLKVIVCTPRPEILDALARAAADGRFRLPIAEIVPLGKAIQLIGALEAGRKLGGKGLVTMG